MKRETTSEGFFGLLGEGLEKGKKIALYPVASACQICRVFMLGN